MVSEQEECQAFLENTATALAEDYEYMHPNAAKYMEVKFTMCKYIDDQQILTNLILFSGTNCMRHIDWHLLFHYTTLQSTPFGFVWQYTLSGTVNYFVLLRRN